MRHRDAFTLIELLVVIAIIAMLLAIVIPAFNTAKSAAALSVDLANQKTNSNAWYMYAQNNKDTIMEGDAIDTVSPMATYATPNGSVTVKCFVAAPQTINGVYSHVSKEDEIRGLEKGALWSYIENPKSYNCPVDKGYTKGLSGSSTTDKIGNYRSYSIIAPYSRWTYSTTATGEDQTVVVKYSDVVNPSTKIVFLEESDMAKGWNHRTWNVYLNSPRWYDPFSINHGGRTTFSFADGHSEAHKWEEKSTLEMMKEGNQKSQMTVPSGHYADYVWFRQHYIPGRKTIPISYP